MNTRLRFVLLIVSGIIATLPQAQPRDFLPEVKALFKIPPLETARLENNLFIVFNGLRFPEENYKTAYIPVFSNNYQAIASNLEYGNFGPVQMQSLESRLSAGARLLEFHFIDALGQQRDLPEYFPCKQYLTKNCIQETLDQQALINQLNEQNILLVERYQTLRQDVDHHDALSFPAGAQRYDDYPTYQLVYHHLSNLQLAKAIIAFYSEDIAQGLRLLEEERALIELFYSPTSRPNLFDATAITTRKQVLSQTLVALLDAGTFDRILNSPRLEALFAPYPRTHDQQLLSSYQRALFNFFPTENRYFNSDRIASTHTLTKEAQWLALNWITHHYKTPDLIPLHLLKRIFSLAKAEDALNSPKPQNPVYHFNQARAQFIEQLTQAQTPPSERTVKTEQFERTWLKRYFSHQGLSFRELMTYFNDDAMVNLYNDYYNVLSHYLTLLTEAPFSEETAQVFERINKDYAPTLDNGYLGRMSEQQSYHQLVYLKYRIERDRLADEALPDFLTAMGDAARHPITKAPYLWDPKARTLALPLAEKKFLPAPIYWNDAATHLLVKIRATVTD